MERFEPRSFIRKVLGMHDMRDMIEQVQDTMQMTDSKKLMKNIEKGQYSLRDMYEQFQQVAKMGPLSKLMGNIPGMPAEMMAGTEQEGTRRMKRMMCIMDSMTDAGKRFIAYSFYCFSLNFSLLELDGDNKPFEDINRVLRVARGSGTTVHEVQEILGQYTKFAEMVKTMGGKNGLMQNMPTDPRKMNPNQMAQMGKMQQQMANMVPPQMLQQMGGMEGLQKMARQMGGMFGRGGGAPGGGMPDMAQMMKALNMG